LPQKTLSTVAVDSKPVLLTDFIKIVIRRKDLAKWIEHEEYRHGLHGAFVRVTYHKSYVIAMIDSFVLGNEAYKVEQRETKYQVILSNRGSLKQFKVNMVSDREPTENEFQRMKLENPKIVVSHRMVKDRTDQIQKASEFQYDKDLLEQLVKEQNYRKIRARNFKGLNLTSIKMTVQGELALLEAEL
jgi:hypothetical protein